MKISLKNIWALTVLMAVLVPTGLLGLWYAQNTYNQQLNASLQQGKQANELLLFQVESEIQQLKMLLQNKSDSLALLLNKRNKKAVSNDMQTLLSLIIKRAPAVKEVMIVSEKGRVLKAASQKLADLKSLSPKQLATLWKENKTNQVPELMLPMQGETYIGAHRTQPNFISMAVPIGQPSQASLIANIDANHLWSSEIMAFEKVKNTYGYILNSHGALITKVKASQYKIGDSLTHLSIARNGVHNKWSIDQSYLGVHGDKVYGVSTVIPSLGWTIISEVPIAFIVEPIKQSLIDVSVVVLVGVLFFLLFVLRVANKTVKPIQQLCDEIERMGKGHELNELHSSGIQELDVLTSGFSELSLASYRDQKHLKESEASFRGVLENTVHGVLFVDNKGYITLVNTALLNMSGYTEDELVGELVEKLVPERFLSHERHRKIYQQKPYSRATGMGKELTLCCKDSSEVTVEIGLTPVNTGENQFIAATVQDISIRKQAEEKIQHQAYFDMLTDLPNRLLCLDRLSQLIADARRKRELVAVLFLDLDDFKKINDSLSHEVGDKMLIEAGRRLKEIIREKDTVGRLGGDEFIVLLSGLKSTDNTRVIADNLVRRFRDPFIIEDRELIMSISIGISIFPHDGINESELLRNADSAMYHAKAEGRNTYSYFTTEMNKDISRQLILEEQMNGALERNEFEVYYQPKIDLKTMQPMGAEALLRWNNSTLGAVSPDEFIPIAEHTGLIFSIGKFVLSSALSATQEWHKNNQKDFCIAVNFSPSQFREKELPNFIKNELKEYNIPAKYLEVEITEGVLMSGHGHIIEALQELHKLDVGIAMDDFGTGYSSLSYLRKYPFSVLKVDRSFVDDLTTVDSSLKLTKAAIAMSHGLHLKVVAEGIETMEQLQTLKAMKCDYGQGYLFGKPMNKKDFTEFMVKSTIQAADVPLV